MLGIDISKADQEDMVQQFVASSFTKQDNEERTCENVSKLTVLGFQRVANFIDLLNVISPIDEEWTKRSKFHR